MKAVSKSVSLPAPYWLAIDEVAPTTPGHDRSGYIRALIEADLARLGKLPAHGAGGEMAEILAIAEEIGVHAALEALRRAFRDNPAGAAAVPVAVQQPAA